MAPGWFGRARGPIPHRCAHWSGIMFGRNLSGPDLDFCQLDAAHYRDGHNTVWPYWDDLGALYLGYSNVDVHGDRTIGDDGYHY